MDALLSYLLFKITIKIILIELAIMVLCCVAIVITKIITKTKANNRKAVQSVLSDAVERALFPEGAQISDNPMHHFSLPNQKYGLRNFVEVLESFEQRFSDIRWTELKKQILEKYVLEDAQKAIEASSWLDRQLAARAYRLYPEKITEPELAKLVNDPKYMVRMVTAVIVCKTSFKQLFYQMITLMSQETTLSQFFYRDALVQADQEKFTWMEELLRHEENPKIVAIILDVLSTRYAKNLFSLIKPFTKSEDKSCRILAIRAIGSVSSEESIQVLTERLTDSDWEVRAECILGLKKQHERKAVPLFAELLNDPIWWVRLQAAKALEEFGQEGEAILKAQDAKLNPHGHEIAAYVLSLQPSPLPVL